jgi:protein SCO1/2
MKNLLTSPRNRVLLPLLLLAGGWSQQPHDAPMTTVPPMLRDVGIDQKLGEQIPLDLAFRDEAGRSVRLGDYFGKKPVILTLVYYKCPTLCTMVLNDLTRTLNVIKETAGEEFDIVTVSFNPKETPELATDKKRQYLRAYRRPSAEQGWHFLTGDEASIKALTSAAGFRYVFDEKQQQYVHASGIMVATPNGRLSRYFYGVDYAPKDLRIAMIEAADGKTSSPTAAVLFYCFKYDPSTGRYSLAITRILQLGALMTLVGIPLCVRIMHKRNGKIAPASSHSGTSNQDSLLQ